MQTSEIPSSPVVEGPSARSRCLTILLLLAAGFALGFSVKFYLDHHNKRSAVFVVIGDVHQDDDDSSPSSDHDETTTLVASQPITQSPPTDNTTTTTTHEQSSSNNNMMWCDRLYSCQTTTRPERLAHSVPLWAGEAICNDEYRFGVTYGGVLQWHNCKTAERYTVFDPFVQEQLWGNDTSSFLFFQLAETGALQLLITPAQGDDAVVYWEKVPTLDIWPTRKCIKNHLMECPYLHLHKESGDVVLNSINEEGGYSDRKVQKIFDDLYHDPCD